MPAPTIVNDHEAREPLRLDPVSLASVPSLAGVSGRLAMTSLPGGPRPTASARPADDLAEDAQVLLAAGVTDLILLVEDAELVRYRSIGITGTMARAGIEVTRYPIADMGTPTHSVAFDAVLGDVLDRLRAGRSVVVACVAGHGRTGTFVACLLVAAGLEPDDAIARTRASRPGTIETAGQLAFVRVRRPPRI
jgi:protein-tyrosine phosphatase